MPEVPCSPKAPKLLSPWRRRCQWAVTLLMLLTPWFHISGDSLLRIDIPSLTLHFFGQTLRIEELYLVLLFSLTLTFGFLLITMVLGRVWCGWLCPQTTLTDLADWFAARIGWQGKKSDQGKGLVQRVVLQIIYLALAFLVSANLLWYFIEPLNFFAKLTSGQLHYVTWICLLSVTLVVFLDLSFVRRLMCRDFCPYGRFQTALADQSTLVLHLPTAELQRCIKCNSCVRACPMEIDIRHGYQVECINCGRCLDACRQVMAKRRQPGLISYTFGTSGQGLKPLFNLRTLLLSVATLALVVILAVAVYQRPTASLKIALSHSVATRTLKNGSRATFFNAWVNNRSNTKGIYRIEARQAENGKLLALKGQTKQLTVDAGGNLKIDFVLVTAVPKAKIELEFLLLDQNNNELAVAEAHIK